MRCMAISLFEFEWRGNIDEETWVQTKLARCALAVSLILKNEIGEYSAFYKVKG